MPHVFSFQVSPTLPPRLEALNKLSLNLRWTWDHPTRDVFESLDPDLWEGTNHNPRLVLGRISQHVARPKSNVSSGFKCGGSDALALSLAVTDQSAK
jgi:hypothetical protein